MKQRLIRYWQQASPLDWILAVFLLLPLALSLTGSYQGTLPFWLMGLLLGVVSYPRFNRRGWGLLLALAGIAVVGTGLIEHNLLSGRWVRPLSDLLWLVLAVPAGLHFAAVSADSQA